jgi:hypothetical protein
MLTRSLAILLAPWLPLAALMLPMGAAHRIDDLVAGTLATLLSAFSLSNDRARIGAAVVGGWVALTAFIFPATLLEEVVALSWGTLMVAWLAGPHAEAPRVIRQPAAAPPKERTTGGRMPLAA